METLRAITDKQRRYVFPQKLTLSDAVKHFIERLLCDDPKDRMSADEALTHCWIVGQDSIAMELAALNELKSQSNSADFKSEQPPFEFVDDETLDLSHLEELDIDDILDGIEDTEDSYHSPTSSSESTVERN